jgi:hypothetical protein
MTLNKGFTINGWFCRRFVKDAGIDYLTLTGEETRQRRLEPSARGGPQPSLRSLLIFARVAAPQDEGGVS